MELTEFILKKAIEVIHWSNNSRNGNLDADLSSKELNRIIDDIYLRGYQDATEACTNLLKEVI